MTIIGSAAVPSWMPGRTILAAVVEGQTETCLNVYREDPARILEDANNEAKISSPVSGR